MTKCRTGNFVAVKQYADGRWGFDSYLGGKRAMVRCRTQDKAEQRAIDANNLLRAGRPDLLSFTPRDIEEFSAWREKRDRSVTFSELLLEFEQAKRADVNLHQGYAAQLVGTARRFEPQWGERPLGSITPGEIAAALDAADLQPRNRNNVRAALVTVWRFARDEREYLPADTKTAPERVRRIKIKRALTLPTYTPEQFHAILCEAKPEFRIAFAIEGLAGVRVHEIRPTAKERKKDPLRFEDFHWRDGYLRIRPETSKTERQRLIPIQPALRKIMLPYRRMTGPILDRSANEELKRIRQKLGLPYTKNGFRHGYGTYRNALINNIAKVAEELGNTIATAEARYVRSVPPKTARRWFSPKLKLPANVVPMQARK